MAVMGVHWLDRFRWLLGQEAHTVFCKSLYSGLLESEGEDLATMVIQFSDGCLANLTEHWCSAARGAGNYFQLDCTQGSIIVRDSVLQVFDGAREMVDERLANADIGPTFAQSMKDLLDAIDEAREPLHSGMDNLGTMALLDAAYMSAERGSRVEIGSE
jgi:predicted dehydrogenase